MNRIVVVLSLALVAACLGCDDRMEQVSLVHGRLTVHPNEVVIERSGGPDAHVLAGGVLRIGSDEVALTSEQKGLAASYFDAAHSIKKHGFETGKAGADVGATAVKEVVSGLAKGDTSQISAKVEESAGKVKASALKICDDLRTIRSAQESLAATLPAFEPYRALGESDVADCAKDLKN